MKKIFNSLFNSFKCIKWWEWLTYTVFVAVIFIIGGIYRANYILFINAFLGITSICLIAKGNFLGPILEIVQIAFYCLMSWQNRYYGEIIVCLGITLPSLVVEVITWIKNSAKETAVVKVNKPLSWVEWIVSSIVIAGISVGMYFLLGYFGNANLTVSIINLALGIMAGYLGLRRCEYTFLFYIVSNCISITLWLSIVLQGDMSYLMTTVMYFEYLFLNSYGLVNWIKLKRLQKKEKNLQENNIS